MSKKPNKEQSESFKTAARELGCDENEAAFEDKLRRIVKSPPPEKGGKKKGAPAK